MKTRLLILALPLLLVACANSDHSGFERLEGSIHYRLNALGDDNHPVATASVVSLDCRLTDPDGRLVAVKSFRRVPATLTAFPYVLRNVMAQSSAGDSMTFIGLGSDLALGDIFDPRLLPPRDTTFTLSLAITEALSDAALRDIMAQQRMAQDLELQEQAQLVRMLDSLKLGDENLIGGIYLKHLKRTQGRAPQSGDDIKVNYRSYLVTGQLIDDTYAAHALIYQVGKPDQVLEGFATGIAQMREGEEALFVVPSAQAFGSRGSSSGIVPPFSTLIYEVKLDAVGVVK